MSCFRPVQSAGLKDEEEAISFAKQMLSLTTNGTLQ